MLETEKDYERWNIDRRQRRGTATPPGSPAEPELPVAWRAAAAPVQRQPAQDQQLAEVLRTARRLLDEGNPTLAHELLRAHRYIPEAVQSAEYRQVRDQAVAAVRREGLMQSLGAHRALFDLSARMPLGPSPSPLRLLAISPSQFGNSAGHAHARQLLQEVEVRPMTESDALPDLLETLRKQPGMYVALDREAREVCDRYEIAPSKQAPVDVDLDAFEEPAAKRAIGDDSGDDPFAEPAGQSPKRAAGPAARAKPRPSLFHASSDRMAVVGRGRMSLLSYARFLLHQYELALVEEPHRVLITTEDRAQSRLSTEVYPVADLLLADQVPNLASLGNPYLECRLAAAERLRAGLRRPMTVGFDDKPLSKVAEHFARFLGDTVLLDARALTMAGVDLDKPVKAAWRDVPAKVSLRWILDEAELDFTIRNEALVITTREEASKRPQVQLHSGCGLVCMTVVDMSGGMGMGMGVGGIGGGFGGMGGIGNTMGMGGMGMGMGGFGGMGMGGGGGMAFGGGMGMGGGGGGGMGMGGGGGMDFGAGMAGSGGAAPGLSNGGDGSSIPQTTPAVEDERSRGTDRGGIGGSMGSKADADADASGGGPPSLGGASAMREPNQTPSVISCMPVVGATDGGARSVPACGPALPMPSIPSFGNQNADFQSVTDLITNTVRKDTWDVNNGPGSINFFSPTLDFVVAGDERSHEEIDSLLQRLRRLPTPPLPKGIQLATVPAPGAKSEEVPDFQGLVDLLTNTVSRDKWDVNNGPSTIAPEPYKVALVVSADQELHEEVSDLLTLLRRSRYAALRHERPWEAGSPAAPLWEPLAKVERAGAPRLAKLPEPEPADREALAARHAPDRGAWLITPAIAGQGPAAQVSFRRSGPRLEMNLVGAMCRIEGDQAAVTYADLGLVELGPWGEAVQQLADVQLPWMPHRNDEELARLFRVRVVDVKQHGTSGAESKRLRLVPRGLSDTGGTWLDLVIGADGQPLLWESYREGALISRVRPEKPGRDLSAPSIVMESADGRVLATWHALPAEGLPSTPIPEVATGWSEHLVLDRRSKDPAVDRPFKQAVDALRRLDWPEAAGHLDSAAKQHPLHPLLPLLRAWCHENDRSLGQREELLAGLRRMAADSRRGPVRLIIEDRLTWLEPAQRHAILEAQPADRRDSADWLNLARAAMLIGRPQDASHAVKAALDAMPDPRPFEQVRLGVELLLQLGQTDEAVKMAQQWAAGLAPPAVPLPPATSGEAGQPAALPVVVEQLASLGELLGRRGRERAAEVLFTQASVSASLTRLEKHGLLMRWAALKEGLQRWRMLLQAAEAAPALSPQRQIAMRSLAGELTNRSQADAAGQLAARTKDLDLQWQLRLRQAELTTDAALAADLAWQLHEAGRLPQDRLAWACEAWNRANQPQRAIEVIEQRLRQARPLSEDLALALAAAYRLAGRPEDARRAETAEWDWEDVSGITSPAPVVPIRRWAPRPRPPRQNSRASGQGAW